MSEPPTKKQRRFGGGTIIINVGSDQVETFTIHESLLEERGGFFAAALSKQWKEGQERKTELPEDDADTVVTYIEWVYTKHISSHREKELQQWSVHDVCKEYNSLARLYIFGEKIQDDEFCNRCIDKIMGNTRRKLADIYGGRHGNLAVVHFPASDTVNTIFRHTHEVSPIRRLCIDMYWNHSNEHWFKPDGGDLDLKQLLDCPDFLLELVRKFADTRTPSKRGSTLLKADDYYK